MGLNIVSHAVERLGGRVWAEPMPGQGAQFFFTVPLAGC
jgi:signal transduction histidine kinase